MMRLIILVFLQMYTCKIINGQSNSYRAAVVEYAPHNDGSTFLENWKHNLREYLQYIQDASNQRAQIIVFPENGLSGLHVEYSDLEVSSTEVPDPNLHILPCTAYYNNNYSSTLRELSCAARNHKIYVVVNLFEKVTDLTNNKKLYHNTNVVFNKNGEVIARHRKVNMYREPYITPGNELTTFIADFGVTFGMFICADIFYKVPSREVLLKPNVTDIIFSTTWFSHLPYPQALSVQHGYAKASGVNLLASGMNNPKEANGGSGIYLADGRIAETYISGIKLSKLIVQDVPKISSRTPNGSCKKASGSYKWGVDPFTGNISGFNTIKQDLHDFTFKPLNLLGQRRLTERICSSSSSFCCTFNISISRTNNIPPNYVYKLAAFQGILGENSTTVGLRYCSILACTGENNESCADRNAMAPRGIRFEEISVTATLDNTEVYYSPDTVTFDLKPVTDYTFCVEEVGSNKVEVIMTTTDSIDSLLTFGIVGRVFKYDKHPAGIINGSIINNADYILMVVLLYICYALHR